MTRNDKFEGHTGKPRDGQNSEDPKVRGRYVEGSYGDAGTEAGRSADDEEGQYTEGDYGAAGSEGALPGTPDKDTEEAGRFVEADYGTAGTVQGRTPGTEIGQYAEGDYGPDGTAGPQRKAGADKE
ncbi:MULTISPECIES: hypothetical protein [Arthrobacter]|uniref:Uncharacterized protein n=1 Tax=Arthrobacter terricola TaxID=2547396 RepID=A0A4V6PIM1_9MICC|nr:MULTISPECIES: hypothetical protein [Arthrobacter]MBT8159525.1 hypothetical protein [Arthrobacter sp. GN70]TDG01345.1 hypothetical protein E1809_02225 [Arthrobacter terricola]